MNAHSAGPVPNRADNHAPCEETVDDAPTEPYDVWVPREVNDLGDGTPGQWGEWTSPAQPDFSELPAVAAVLLTTVVVVGGAVTALGVVVVSVLV